MTDRLDLESRLRDSLVDAAAGAPGAVGLAAAARRRARVRRRRRAAGVVVAAGLAAVPLVSLLGPGENRGTGPVVDDNEVSEGLDIPTGWRVESYHDLQILVPNTWEYGSLETWCARGDGEKPGRAAVERPGEAAPAVDCSSPREGYGVQFLDEADAPSGRPGELQEIVGTSSDTNSAPHPIGAWVGHADVGAAVVASVVAPSEFVASYLLESARRIDGLDANGCAPAAAGPPASAGTVSVCRYDGDGALEQSERLTGANAEVAIAAIEALPADSGPAGSCPEEGPPDEVLVSTEERRLVVQFQSGCSQANGVFEGGERVAGLTPDLLAWSVIPGGGYVLGEGVPEPANREPGRP